MKLYFSLLIIVTLSSCSLDNQEGIKTIDTGAFEIDVPDSWKYHKEKGDDSFVGRIVGNEIELFFDWSEMGYANSLILTEQEYIYEHDYLWMPVNLPYGKDGVIYTTGDIEGVRQQIMREKGIRDPLLVKVEPFQIPMKQVIHSGNEYAAILTYKDTSIRVAIEIPEEIRNHNIQVDTVGHYICKLITPRKGIDGMTGVYFKDLNSNFNFNIVGSIKRIRDQESALRAFKTIKIKREVN